MRTIPTLEWNRRHNVARLWVSFASSLWDAREIDEPPAILGYSAVGRLARVLLLDPKRLLPPGACAADALAVVLPLLERHPDVPERDVAVVRSALDRLGAGRGQESRRADGGRSRSSAVGA